MKNLMRRCDYVYAVDGNARVNFFWFAGYKVSVDIPRAPVPSLMSVQRVSPDGTGNGQVASPKGE